MISLELWRSKLATGLVRYDPDVLVMRPAAVNSESVWGSVYYSAVREKYKSEVKQVGRTASFDLVLMEQLRLGETGGLIVAANPNSLFEGHLVIYPKLKEANLTPRDFADISELAACNANYTFIHNMERSAASIVDWAHFQAYPVKFPIEVEACRNIHSGRNISLWRVSDTFPAYALLAESTEVGITSQWLHQILCLLQNDSNPSRRSIPVNFIWKGRKVWVIPRAEAQSNLAATYFGGLEMGGIFCLPNASEFPLYLPHILRRTISEASLANEPETQAWFEEHAICLMEAAS